MPLTRSRLSGRLLCLRGRAAGPTWRKSRMSTIPPAASATRRELSGITPSGPLTLGNYLGALRRFRDHQDNGFYFVANLHALTTDHDPRRLRHLTLSTAALFLAAGLDPDRKSTRLNSSHGSISYAVFCLKKKKKI